MTRHPDVVRSAYAELVVTDLAAARWFYVDVLGLAVTAEDDDALYLRAFEEFIHHNLVLRQGPGAPPSPHSPTGCARPRTSTAPRPATAELGCRTERRPAGFVTRASATRCASRTRSGFPFEFFYEAEHVERLTRRYDLLLGGRARAAGPLQPGHPGRARAAAPTTRASASGCPRTSRTTRAPTYAAWMHRKHTVHDIALTGGDGPRMHHIAFATHEKHHILAHLRQARRAAAVRPHRARPRPARRLQRLLPLPARPRRPPHRDLHAGLLHRRPGQPDRHVGRARQPAPRLVGQPGRAVLVHRGLASCSTSTARRSR